MKNITDYITEGIVKDRIKSYLDRFRKDRSDVKTTKTVEDYRDMTVTEDEIDEIIAIKDREDTKGFLFGGSEYTFSKGFVPMKDKSNDRSYIWTKLGYKQGMLDFAYRNFSGTLGSDPFGEKDCDSMYYRVERKHNDDRDIQSAVLSRYFYGFNLAKELNLKCENKIELDI